MHGRPIISQRRSTASFLGPSERQHADSIAARAYGGAASEPTAVYLECPGTLPFDPERQTGKETLLCAYLDAEELAAAQAEFGDRVLLLRGRRN